MLYDKRWEQQTKPLQQWQEDLLGTAAYIRKHGWCQGAGENSKGEVCILGGLNNFTTLAEPDIVNRNRRYLKAAGKLALTLGYDKEYRTGVINYNDTHTTTMDQVLSFIERTVRSA